MIARQYKIRRKKEKKRAFAVSTGLKEGIIIIPGNKMA